MYHLCSSGLELRGRDWTIALAATARVRCQRERARRPMIITRSAIDALRATFETGDPAICDVLMG